MAGVLNLDVELSVCVASAMLVRYNLENIYLELAIFKIH